MIETKQAGRFPVSRDTAYAWAQLDLAALYLNREGVAAESARAVTLYKRAAAAGIPQAMTALDNFCTDGQSGKQDLAMAARWCEAGAGAGPLPPDQADPPDTVAAPQDALGTAPAPPPPSWTVAE